MATNKELIESIATLTNTVERLRVSVDDHKRDVSIALAGDYTAPNAKPGLIQTVNAHVVACNDDRRKLWIAVRLCGSVILLILGWIVAGKITSEPKQPTRPAPRIVTTP